MKNIHQALVKGIELDDKQGFQIGRLSVAFAVESQLTKD